jgi:DNA-binding MarR family transcriptional regulator
VRSRTWRPQDSHNQHQTLKFVYFGPEGDRSSVFDKQLDLADLTGLRKGTISKHLKALRRECLVMSEAIDVTDAGINRLKQLFPNEEFDL